MLDRGHDLTLCSAVGAKFISDDSLGEASLFLHQSGQKAPGSLGVAATRGDFVEYIAFLVDNTPEPMLGPPIVTTPSHRCQTSLGVGGLLCERSMAGRTLER